MALKRDEILEAQDQTIEEVAVPEWGGVVLVRGMTGAERDALEAETGAGGMNLENFRARLLVRCIVDAEGQRVFRDEDAEALGKKNARALDRIFAVATRLSGLTNDEVEALTKN